MFQRQKLSLAMRILERVQAILPLWAIEIFFPPRGKAKKSQNSNEIKKMVVLILGHALT